MASPKKKDAILCAGEYTLKFRSFPSYCASFQRTQSQKQKQDPSSVSPLTPIICTREEGNDLEKQSRFIPPLLGLAIGLGASGFMQGEVLANRGTRLRGSAWRSASMGVRFARLIGELWEMVGGGERRDREKMQGEGCLSWWVRIGYKAGAHK
ncbi:hypothetical protein P154DRAFT_308614 [Amniculicola lignicola CBS 123094]|uniref:Uncharacterized protein n=1 Tax=Amniculicola lignicola CBS 123094 TaxID=1392246 RepID=A0A6A5W8Z9_9PLEO|nr:hypothetical protein P154DRAFT_308614 [Amniculicola lignicola CBS 123094]